MTSPAGTAASTSLFPVDTGTGLTFTMRWRPPSGTSLPYLTFYNDMKYDSQWLWVKPEANDTARIGFTDYAKEAMGPVWSIDFDPPGKPINRGFTFGFIQGEDTMDVNLTAPVSGTILEVNHDLLADFSLISKSPYDRGWFIVVKLSHPEELEMLLTPAQYARTTLPPCHCAS